MKAIYDAVRALVYPGQAQHQAGPAFATGSFRAKTRDALKAFELTNRGIRHKLGSPSLRLPIDGHAYFGLTPKERDARERLYQSLVVLAEALAQGQHPDAKKLEPLLLVRDESGWLELYASKVFEKLMENTAALKLNDKLGARGILRVVDDKVELKLRLWTADLGMYEDTEYADRTVVLDLDVRTLAGVLQLEKLARITLKELFKDARQWEEFKDYSPYGE